MRPHRLSRIWATLVAILLVVVALPLAATNAAANVQSIIDIPNAPAWTESTGALNASVECLTEDPTNGVIYGCHYRGMVRSLDGGLSWERAGQFDAPAAAPGGALLHRHYHAAAVASDGTVFVGNQEGNVGQLHTFPTGMVRMSKDGGLTWQTITPESTHAHRPEINRDTTVAAIVVDSETTDPAKKDRVYFCSGNKLYRSDGTAHQVDPQWTNVDPNTGNPIGPQPEIKWRQIVPTRAQASNSTGGLGTEDNLCTALLIDGGSLYMASTEGIWRSDNYADTLPAGGPPDPSNIIWNRITSGTAIEAQGVASMIMDGSGQLYVGSRSHAQGARGVYVSSDPSSAAPTFAQVQTSNAVAMTIAADGALVAARSSSGRSALSRASNPVAAPDLPTAFTSEGAVAHALLTLADGSMLYATNGLGVLRSVDNGVTWQQSNEGLHHFHQPKTVGATGRIYATSGKGMAFSDDDGRSFANCGPLDLGNRPIAQIIFRDVEVLTDGSLAAIVHGPGSLPGLWHSNDRCGTWVEGAKRSNGGPVAHLAAAPNGELFAFDQHNMLIRSTDQGVTWTQRAPLPQSGGVQDLAVAPNGDLWVLSGIVRAYRSTDGGASWSEPAGLPAIIPHIPGLMHGDHFAFAPDGTVFVAVQRGVSRLAPGATVFQPTGLSGPLLGLSSIARDSAGQLYVAAANIVDFDAMGIYVSPDDGVTWLFEPNSVADRFRLAVWVNPQTDTALINGSGENLHYRAAPAPPTVSVPALANWNPNNGSWQVTNVDGSNRVSGVTLGTGDAVALSGDVNGDGQDDFVSFRPGYASWSAVDADGTVLVDGLIFGNPDSHNHPLIGDVDGDGDDDFVIWDESLGRFFSTDSDGTALVGAIRHGNPGQVPLMGDVDGDGKDDFIIFVPWTARWYVKDSDGVTNLAWNFRWGTGGDIPLVGDIDGDGTDDFVVWRASNGNWYAKAADGTALVNFVQWGRAFDTPVIGDINDDGKDDFLVWRPHTKQWFGKSADNSIAMATVQTGSGSDTPLFVTVAE